MNGGMFCGFEEQVFVNGKATEMIKSLGVAITKANQANTLLEKLQFWEWFTLLNQHY